MNHHRPYQHPTLPTPAPQLPAGIEPAVFVSRMDAMIEAGTHPMIAEKLALDATQNQVLRDRHPKFVAASADEPTIAND